MHISMPLICEYPIPVFLFQNDLQMISIIEFKRGVNEKSIDSFRNQMNFSAYLFSEVLLESVPVQLRSSFLRI